MLIAALVLVAAWRPIRWLCCHLVSAVVLDILVVFTLVLLDAFHFSTIFFGRGLPLVPLTPLGRVARPNTRWLLVRKPFLPLDHFLLYFLFFVTLAETCSHIPAPFPSMGKILVATVGAGSAMASASHFTPHVFFCLLPFTPAGPVDLLTPLCDLVSEG